MRFRDTYISLNEALTLADIPKKKGEKDAVFMYGRMQPPTAAHVAVVQQMLDEFPTSTAFVFIVRGAKSGQDKEHNPLTSETQKEILEKSLGALVNRVQVRTISTGFLGEAIKALRDDGYEPVAMFTGTDRMKSYEQQIAYCKDCNLNLQLKEIKRSDEDISATRVREAIRGGDFETFKKMTVGLDKKDFKRLQKEMAL